MRSEIRTALILGAVIALGVGVISMTLSSFDQAGLAGDSGQGLDLAVTGSGGISKLGLKTAPNLVGIAHYLNTTPEKLAEEIEDSVVLYDIWTYSCINCVRTLPYITAWSEKYSDEGLLIVGIHSPEFEFEKDLGNVQMAVEKHGIGYPVVLDNDKETWKAFENRYWPRKYIADHEGYIRYDHIGEGGYKETEKVIQKLLEERNFALGIRAAEAVPFVDIEEFKHTAARTPELYLGYMFAQNRNQLGSDEGFQRERIVEYLEPDDDALALHKFYPVGSWKNEEDSMQLVSQTGSIKLLYHGKEVNIVTAGSTAELKIFLDGQPLSEKHAGRDVTGSTLVAVEPDIYNIVASPSEAIHVLELEIAGSGIQVFTFTFG